MTRPPRPVAANRAAQASARRSTVIPHMEVPRASTTWAAQRTQHASRKPTLKRARRWGGGGELAHMGQQSAHPVGGKGLRKQASTMPRPVIRPGKQVGAKGLVHHQHTVLVVPCDSRSGSVKATGHTCRTGCSAASSKTRRTHPMPHGSRSGPLGGSLPSVQAGHGSAATSGAASQFDA